MLIKIAASVFVVIVVCGFAWLALTDIPVSQTTAVEVIPNERFFD